MKNFYAKEAKATLILTGLLTLSAISPTLAQNLVSNSGFSGGTSTGWSTGCSIEVNPESVYGGPSASIYVTEIDAERCINQQVCILPGLSYIFTYQATRRPQSGTPANPGIQVKVTGTTSNTDYVNSIQSYTSTTWDLQTRTFTITIPSNSTDKKLNIQFTPNNNTSTYGVIISDIELAPAISNMLSINGPTTSAAGSPNNFSLSGSPAGISYAWSFSGDANMATSASASPTAISWASMGSRTVSVAVSNSVCTMASYSHPITISALLAVELTNFTGQAKDNSAWLSWMADNGSGAGHFIIERSGNGSDFDSIGVVALNNTGIYDFTDKAMLNGNNYYRLQLMNEDGVVHYSSVIALAAHAADAAGKIQVYPNPVVSVLNYTITGAKAGPAVLQIYNVSGIPVMAKEQSLSEGTSQQSIVVPALKTGHYFLKINDTRGNSFLQAFEKM